MLKIVAIKVTNILLDVEATDFKLRILLELLILYILVYFSGFLNERSILLRN